MPDEPKSLTRSKVKEFFCELFDAHEWKQKGKPFKKNDIDYIRFKCAKCGKEKEEPAPVFLVTPFFTSTRLLQESKLP